MCDSETDATLKLYDERVEQAKDEIIKSLLDLMLIAQRLVSFRFLRGHQILETKRVSPFFWRKS